MTALLEIDGVTIRDGATSSWAQLTGKAPLDVCPRTAGLRRRWSERRL